jgi:CheY-like chemotaxis protein
LKSGLPGPRFASRLRPEVSVRVQETASDACVLVVDDEELYLRALVADFQHRGYKVTARRDMAGAESAFREMWRRGDQPILVVDLIQPGENGGHLGGLDLLRRLERERAGDILALVDSEADWLATTARSLGASRVIRKPDLRRTEPEHLDRALKGFLGEIAGEAAAPQPSAQGEPTERAAEPGPLLGALEELRHAPDRVAVLLLVMRLASDLASRGVLYEVEGDHLRGLGSFGLSDDDASHVTERLLALDKDTLPGRAFWSARLQRARGKDLAALSHDLSGPEPAESVAVPIIGPGGVTAVLYTDSGDTPDGLADLRPLSALAGAASLALDRFHGGAQIVGSPEA